MNTQDKQSTSLYPLDRHQDSRHVLNKIMQWLVVGFEGKKPVSSGTSVLKSLVTITLFDTKPVV